MSKPKNIEHLGFNDFWLRLLGIPLIGLFVLVIFMGESIAFSSEFFTSWLISSTYTFIYWSVAKFVFLKVRAQFTDYRQVGYRIFWQTTAIVLIVLIISWLIRLVEPLIFNHHRIPPIRYLVVGSLVSATIMTSIYESVYFFSQWKKAILNQEELKRANVQSQLETLKSQVNPHFLFNSLNTLAAIIPDDPEVAVEFVQNLSKVYRHILEFREKSTITIEEEIKALKAYIFLLKIRFGDNLRVQIDIPKTIYTQKIVPLSLQMLLENAVKHNIVSTKKPLLIDIFIEQNQLIVKNNLQQKRQTLHSTKFGLENIKKRYQLLTQQSVEVIITTTSFIVTLPLIKT